MHIDCQCVKFSITLHYNPTGTFRLSSGRHHTSSSQELTEIGEALSHFNSLFFSNQQQAWHSSQK